MNRRTPLAMTLAAAALAVGLTNLPAQAQTTTLRVFSGGANQRPDLMRKLFDQYQAANPGVKIDIETGGATSELQRQYLSTVLNAKDPAIDIFMIDIVNPGAVLRRRLARAAECLLGRAGRRAEAVSDRKSVV